MSMKGYLSNLWNKAISVGNGFSADVRQEQGYASLANHSKDIYALKTSPKILGSVATALAIDAVDANGVLSRFVLPVTAHTIKQYDVIRMTSGTQLGEEAQVISTGTDYIVLIGLSAAPVVTDTFDQLRYVSATADLNGNQFVTPPPRTVVDIMDIPLDVPTGGRAIPAAGGAFLEIVTATAAPITELMMSHDMGEFVNLYTGLLGAEVFLCHLPLTPDEKVPVAIAVGTRLSVQAGKAVIIDDVTSAYAINFIG